MKMNQEVKTSLLEALRGGEYEQGIYKLRSSDNEFCCLGVLCDLHSKKFGIPWEPSIGRYLYLGQVAELPYEVQEWSGLNSKFGLINDYQVEGGMTLLAKLNDQGMEFEKIAETIEKCL